MESRFETIGGQRLHYAVAGTGEPLVLIHGLCGSGKWWSRNLAGFARRYRVFVIDLFGFGRSRGGVLRLERAAEVLEEWTQRVGIGPARFVGHSMGGLIAMKYAVACPAKIRQLVLVSSVGAPFQRSHVSQAVGMVRELVLQLKPDFYRPLVESTIVCHPVRTLSLAVELFRADALVLARRVTCPVQVIWGEKDYIVPLHLGHALAQAIRGSRLDVIAGAGHVPMWDHPARFNELVHSFFDEIVTSDA